MYKKVTVREAAILTNSYVAGTIIGPNDNFDSYNQLNLAISFTIGSLTDCDIKAEYSLDGITYFQETFASFASNSESTEALGHHTYAATGEYTLSLPVKWRYCKISAIGNGTVTDSSLAITAILGNT